MFLEEKKLRKWREYFQPYRQKSDNIRDGGHCGKEPVPSLKLLSTVFPWQDQKTV